jgi:plasmid stabilization system protein ParE
MKRRYVLAPEAALDLVQIWRYIKKESSPKIADRVEAAIRDEIVSLAKDLASATGARISRTSR